MQSKFVVLLFVDIVDYSRTMDANQSLAIQMVRDLKEKYLEPIVFAQGGEILKRMGDGWIIAFHSADTAVQTAIDVQKGLVENQNTRLRIGAHVGEIVIDDEDFYGPGVNLAQRIQVEAPPGGVMVSQDLYRQMSGDLAQLFKDAGSFKLKNIALPLTLFQWRPSGTAKPDAEDVPSIAVKAFEFVPENSDARAIAADLRDQLIIRLSNRTGIRVLDEAASRSRMPVYRLEGRIRLSDKRGRLSLSLILCDSEAKIWAQIYDGDASDIFSFCDDIINRADSDLRVQINQFDGDRIARLPDDQLSISELRSRAATVLHEYTIASWEHARELLERALRMNPADPMAKAMHCETMVALAAAKYQDLSEEAKDQIARDLDEAVEMSPRSDYIFWARAYFRVHSKRDSAGARRDVQRTLSLSPAYAHGYELLGLVDLLDGEYARAKENLSKAISLSETDPILPYRHFALAVCLYCAKEFSAAIESIDRAIQLKPSIRQYLKLREACQQSLGLSDDAQATAAQAAKLSGIPSMLALRLPLLAEANDLLSVLTPISADADQRAR
jgi:adenylate cyclase